jgi:lysophospholipase L1-like esterase
VVFIMGIISVNEMGGNGVIVVDLSWGTVERVLIAFIGIAMCNSSQFGFIESITQAKAIPTMCLGVCARCFLRWVIFMIDAAAIFGDFAMNRVFTSRWRSAAVSLMGIGLMLVVGCESPAPIDDSLGTNKGDQVGDGASGAKHATKSESSNQGGKVVSAGQKDGDVVVSGPVLKIVEPTVQPKFIQKESLDFTKVIQKNDRILFVGDGMTQQMYYTRAFASGVMGIKPRSNLRVFNGGKESATAESAAQWVDDLIEYAKPTVVFVCFGLNDGGFDAPNKATTEKYEKSLAALATKIKSHQGVRQIVLLSSPAIQTGSVADENRGGYNRTLYELALATQRVAKSQDVGFVDLFEPMRVANTEAAKLGGSMLTIGGKLPNEEGHTVIASVIMWGIGVTTKQLDPVGWAPLKPRSMGRVRGALGIATHTPDFQVARSSRHIYETLREHDQIFFQGWRLGKRLPKRYDRKEMMKVANEKWMKVDGFSRAAYANIANAN